MDLTLKDDSPGHVARIRGEIASGTFETEERLSVSADRLLDDLHNHGLRVDRVVMVEPHRLAKAVPISTLPERIDRAAEDAAGDEYGTTQRDDRFAQE